MTREQVALTAVWLNGGCGASCDNKVQGWNEVIQLNFCSIIHHYPKKKSYNNIKCCLGKLFITVLWTKNPYQQIDRDFLKKKD